MKTLSFTCKTVTPLVMNGAYGDFPELRPPGIKASLRFWWRALQGHLTLDQLREQESKIFGSTKGRSKVLVRLEESIEEKIDPKTCLLPHRNTDREKSPVPAFISGLSFTIRIDFDEVAISEEEMKNLFILGCTLGGWGKRSRRGFGSIAIMGVTVNGEIDNKFEKMPEKLEHIYNLLPKKYFEKANDVIYSNFGRDESYPYLKSIQIGKEYQTNQNLLTDIISASHEVKEEEYERAKNVAIQKNDFREQYNRQTKRNESVPNAKRYSNFEKAIGDGNDRFASPIYVSELGRCTIITTLKSVPKGRFDENVHGILQTQFKDNLLNP